MFFYLSFYIWIFIIILSFIFCLVFLKNKMLLKNTLFILILNMLYTIFLLLNNSLFFFDLSKYCKSNLILSNYWRTFVSEYSIILITMLITSFLIFLVSIIYLLFWKSNWYKVNYKIISKDLLVILSIFVIFISMTNIYLFYQSFWYIFRLLEDNKSLLFLNNNDYYDINFTYKINLLCC